MGKRHKPPQEIIAKLRQIEVMAGQDTSTADAIRSIGVTEVTLDTSCRGSPRAITLTTLGVWVVFTATAAGDPLTRVTAGAGTACGASINLPANLRSNIVTLSVDLPSREVARAVKVDPLP
jgi:hypothetical protein